MNILAFALLAAVALLASGLALWLLLHRGDRGEAEAVLARLDNLAADQRHLREALSTELRAGRSELAQVLHAFRQPLVEQLASGAAAQQAHIEAFGLRLEQLTRRVDESLQALSDRQDESARKNRQETGLALAHLGEQQQQRLQEVRQTLELQLTRLQNDNAARLEQMRVTVDEKLQSTLETRLGQSFQLVSERLEAVQRGLGEMQHLATGVGDLKRVLSNVKTRGIFGEVQLAALLEQILVPEQYAANVATVPGSNDRVEFAIRLPGSDEHQPVWLPIDAKFPLEDYQRLLDAQEAADAEAAVEAGRRLEQRVREEARRIRDKYIAPPHTTDFGILFLPTEGLYAETIRRPGLSEWLQREQRISLAGPSTLTALLNSLQMGFRTLAIEKRSSEVWQLLGAVKTEFHKFATILEKAEKQLHTVSRSIGDAGKKTRTIERRLRGVESLGIEQSQQWLGSPTIEAEDEAEPPGPATSTSTGMD
ncbi:DNA recombination protein RmuC [Frateuria aurantia]